MNVLHIYVILRSIEYLYLVASLCFCYSARQVSRSIQNTLRPKSKESASQRGKSIKRVNLWVNDKSSSLKKCLVVSVLSDGKRHLVLMANRNKPSLFPRLKRKFGNPPCLLSTSLDLFGRRAGWWCVCCPINCFCQLNTNKEYIPNKS